MEQNSPPITTTPFWIVEVNKKSKAERASMEEVRSMEAVQSTQQRGLQEERFSRLRDGRSLMEGKRDVLLLQEFYPTLRVLLLIRMY